MFEDLQASGALDAIIATVTTYGVKVLGAVAVLMVGRIVAGGLRRSVGRTLEKQGVDATLTPFISSMVYWLAMVVVLIAVLTLFGVNTASLVAVLGAASLAVGLALQGTLANFAAGVMLLIFRPFRVGDLVDLGGTEGVVEAIGVFSTSLNSLDNIRIIVPNGEVYGKTIKNYSANETRRVDMVVGVGYGDDLTMIRETITRIVKADARVLSEPAPDIEVVEMADSSVNFVVRPWVKTDDYWPVRFALTEALKTGIEAAGGNIPFPQRDIHLHQAS